MHQPVSPRPPAASRGPDQAPLGFGEFVALIAAMMSLTALGIDSMLPALPAIGETLGITENNDRQWVITSFLLGFAFGQIAYGPLSDRYGRKRVLVVALAVYVLANLVIAASSSFALLLASRAVSGIGVAGARVVTIALVRDCFAGRAMARVMSLAFIVFMAAPILAPSFGQAILLVGSWRLIFVGIACVGAAVLIWFALRMPETLAPDQRQSLDPRRIGQGYLAVLRDRSAVGYTLAAAALSGALFGFIGSVQQIIFDVFERPDLLVFVFAAVASTMAVGSYLNSRIVMHLGTRRISHWALTGFILFSGAHLAVAASGQEGIVVFTVLQACVMACFGLATANFSAMAMENMGAIAGTASSFQGFVTTLAGALIGAAIGQAFDGTTVPLYTGFVLMGLIAYLVVFVAERGRMYTPS